MDRPIDLPVACSLSPETIRIRSAQLLPGVVARASGREAIPNGLRLRFTASTDTLHAIVAAIDAERHCCRFLRFDLTVEPDGGSIWLTLSGPAGTAEFLDALVQE